MLNVKATIHKLVLLVIFLLFSVINYAQGLPLKKGMVIEKSTIIIKGTYTISSFHSLDKAVIEIQGNDIIVDFNNALLKSDANSSQPDLFTGIAIRIRNSRNITIRNLKVSGYKLAVIADSVQNLIIENCDLSYNYRKRLNSTQEKEDVSDWMSYHQNEKDEWLRYGAAIYLKKCDNAIIRNNKVNNGQNALMMMLCNNGLIYNNDFSFNSGIGIGMYRSSNNKLLYNRVIFNVRGYSHGVYSRGQDSAGFLVYEQSNNNLFYKNAATHSGDGFFLWAGQTTMDSGSGGCNDNILYKNDFSYAPTNGIEVTFSRNSIIDNRIFECNHGIWGGYSYNTSISQNLFRNNKIAIAIEHGQENTINHNLFINDQTAIRLWARHQQPSDWGYAKYKDTRSRGYKIAANSFNKNEVVFDLKLTDSIAVFSNRYSSEIIFQTDSTVTNIDREYNDSLLLQLSEDIFIDTPTIFNPHNPFKGSGKLAGRKNIKITPWGPYNFEYPLLWLTNPTDTSGVMKFEIIGPKGQWRIVSNRGLSTISHRKGKTGTTITGKKVSKRSADIQIIAEYTGPAFIDAYGNRHLANKPYLFSFKHFFQPIDFDVKWFAVDSGQRLIKDTGAIKKLNITPFKKERVNRLEYAWWGGIKQNNVIHAQFLTVAEGVSSFPKGEYELSVTWDDAVQVYVDNKLLMYEWDPSIYKFDESPNRRLKLKLNGKHRFKIVHLELGGFATLNLKIIRLN